MCIHASVYWMVNTKDCTPVDGRIIITSTQAGLYTSMGQTNYGPAKAGIANMTIVLSGELGRYGVTVNAISPGARTRMTETIRRPGAIAATPADGFDSGDPSNVSPLVVWRGSPQARDVTARVARRPTRRPTSIGSARSPAPSGVSTPAARARLGPALFRTTRCWRRPGATPTYSFRSSGSTSGASTPVQKKLSA